MSKQTKNDMGFTTIYTKVIADQQLSTTDKAVFMALSTFCYNGKDTCFPSYKTLGTMLKLSTRTIARSIKKLKEVGYVKVERNLGYVNLYTLFKPIIESGVTKVKETITRVKSNYNKKKNKFHSYQQRDYNMEELEKKLLGWT
ncbi:helix-turn-helix domain-containing protein [Clostridium sp. UBA4395]|uniref:helix-turn-helix domain-containing protein n=1 Tax=Clostridium sp. UBA4395 TaxID=1946360 RepID=UPI0032180E40